LPGVARAHLLSEARGAGVKVEERRYGLEELFSADEIIITSSSKIARGVETINGKKVGGKSPKLLSYLQEKLYSDYINSTQSSR
jgi:D-alanine transaminase